MSSRKRIVIVAKKEIIEFIRDWRTIVALVLIPLLFFLVVHCVPRCYAKRGRRTNKNR